MAWRLLVAVALGAIGTWSAYVWTQVKAAEVSTRALNATFSRLVELIEETRDEGGVVTLTFDLEDQVEEWDGKIGR